jgi:hypothetical protein
MSAKLIKIEISRTDEICFLADESTADNSISKLCT